MSLTINPFPTSTIDEAEIAVWRTMPTAIVSDELNRFQCMDAGICSLQPIQSGFAGLAMTVRTMESDNLAIHHAVSIAPAGVVLVVEAGGGGRNAVWGGILHRAAELRGICAVIVDGYVRDTAELKASAVPCFCRGSVPAGPQKSWGGEINGLISAGGCPVTAGDLVIVDTDGVVVVADRLRTNTLAGCNRRLQAERQVISRLEAGETTVEIFGLAS